MNQLSNMTKVRSRSRASDNSSANTPRDEPPKVPTPKSFKQVLKEKTDNEKIALLKKNHNFPSVLMN
jgi:hypothetical protein